MCAALRVGVELRFKDVREKKHFHHPKQDQQFNRDQQPQLPTHFHAAKALDIEIGDPAQQGDFSAHERDARDGGAPRNAEGAGALLCGGDGDAQRIRPYCPK